MSAGSGAEDRGSGSPAHRLRELSGGGGGRTAVVAEPDPAGATLVLGAAGLGGLVSVLNPRWKAAEMAWVLDRIRPERVVAGPGVVMPNGLRGELPGGVPLLRWSHSAHSRLVEPGELKWPGPRTGPEEEGDETEWLVWTSGTTGKPRGVLIPHGAFLASARAAAERLGLGPGDRWIGSLSPAHVGGLALVLRAGVLGSSLLLPGSFDPGKFNRAVDREGATHASLVPTQLLHVLEERRDRPFPSAFRGLLLGGAPAAPDLLERALAARVPLALTYGMTETASQAATAPPALVRRKPGTVGSPLQGVELRAGTETTGPAEIRVRGGVLARGLFRGPDREPLDPTDEKGWLHTGDLGVVDEEGHLWVTGRISDRIVSGGVNVDPAEVEGALLLHPGVREAAVVGVPDERWGERVVAVVVPGDPARPPILEEVVAALRPRLSAPKLPRGLVVADDLPRTATGKVDRRRAGELARRGTSAPEGGGTV